MLRVLASLVLIAAALGPAAATDLTADDRAWIAACVARLAAEPAPSAEVKQRYCACMHEQFDDNQAVTQTEMERMYPPLHRACNRESGWK
ncbi:MAG: hypothetical protein JSR72_13015 [Proteobacteria bacterium]|nr:hypothetical protein [Pseudomonadota bacterium]